MTFIKKYGILLALIVASFPNLTAQGLIKKPSNHNIFISAGATAYSGDIGGMNISVPGVKDWELDNPRYSVSVGYRNKFSDRWAYKGLLSFLRVAATDKGIPRYESSRNFAFESNVFEAALHLEYSFLKGSFNRNNNDYSAYLFLGAGVMQTDVNFSGSPRRIDTYKQSDLAPFFPVGIGYEIDFNRISLGLEIQGQYSLSDYVDGIDSASPSKFSDAIGLVNLTFAYNIQTRNGGRRSGGGCKCNAVW